LQKKPIAAQAIETAEQKSGNKKGNPSQAHNGLNKKSKTTK